MTVTIKGSMPGAINDAAGASVSFAAMSAKVADATGTVIGTATTVTRDSSGIITFVPTGTYSPSLIYYVYLVKTSDGEILTRRVPVWVESSNGTYYFEDFEALARFQESISKNLQAVERSTDDTRAIEFIWPVAGDSAGSANIGGSAAFTTKTRRFKPLATTETISGAITFVGTINGDHWWKLAYNINDRADDGVTIIPAEIEYALTDSGSRSGTFTLVLSEPGGADLTVLPGSIEQQARNDSSSMVVFVGEAVTVSRTVLDANGVPFDMTGKSMKLYIDDAARKRVTSITPTISGSTFTATLSVGLSDVEKMCEFGLWDETNASAKVLIAKGKVDIQYAPGPLSPT
jgi:hypothetical protein